MMTQAFAASLGLLLAGCVSAPPSPPVTPTVKITSATTAAQKKATLPEVVHTARYTLVSLSPDDSLRFPLHQITTRTLLVSTAHHRLTREDALRGWLKGTGYGLCLAVTPAMKMFYSSPLPDTQRRMGPVRTERALQTIAGSAWIMAADEVSRTVCWLPSPAARTLN